MAKSGLIGMGDCLATLSALSKATARNVGRRSLIPAGTILRDAVEARAPERTGALKRSVRIDNTMSKGKRRVGAVDLTVIADDAAAVPDEFGTSDTPVLAFFRPEIEATKDAMFEATAASLRTEVNAAAARVAKKAR